jgi:hypothetical protein
VPFDRWPVQAFDPAFGYAWYARPATYVTQMWVTHGTVACARFIQDHIDLLLVHKKDEIAAAGGLLVLHDWRHATGYDTEARREFIERLRGRPRYMRRAVTCVAVTPVLRMVIEAGNLVAKIVTGAKSELAEDPAPILREERVEVPAAGSRFPGE